MDLPLIGTVDLTPSGLFLVFAVLVAVGYLGWQIFGARRKGSGTSAEEALSTEADDGRRQGDDEAVDGER